MAGLLPAYEPGPVRIASARSTETSIKESVKTVVEFYIKAYGLESEFDVRSMWIDHANGSHMLFPGVTNKLESFLSMEGIDVFWMEQAEILGEEMIYVDPTIRKLGAERWFSWNPFKRADWCWKRFVGNPQPGDVSLWINYHDNPWWHLTGLEETRLYWLEAEPSLYKWMWLGYPNDDDASAAVLPYDTLLRCVDAHRRGLAPPMLNQRVTYAGLDLAEGGRDKCALVVRHGPTVVLVEQWPGESGDLSIAAGKAKDLCLPYNLTRIYYDASSPAKTDLIRAGFRGVRAVNFGGKVGGPEILYEPRRPNKAVFARRNAQLAEALRLRANRTVRMLNGDQRVDPTNCLFIPPDLPRLEEILGEWSQPTRRLNITTGLWEVEKAAADERSPDRYDGLALAFAVETDNRGLKAR